MIMWDKIDPNSEFRGKALDGMDFSGRMLVGVDFSNCQLHQCNFNNCDLSHANFENSDLYRASFCGAVLYGAKFRNNNLTRGDFSKSYIYGVQVTDYSNVTYCKFEKFQLERQRRSSRKLTNPMGQQVYKIGQMIDDIGTLSARNFYINGYCFEFRAFDSSEQHMQRSQIYNRLKRLFASNSLGEEARSCYYWERYYRTRSWYKYHSFTGERVATGDVWTVIGRVLRSALAYVYEQLAGYGLKPHIVLRNFALTYAIYCALVLIIVNGNGDAGVLYGNVELLKGASQPSLLVKYTNLESSNFLGIAYFCFYSMFALAFQNFVSVQPSHID